MQIGDDFIEFHPGLLVLNVLLQEIRASHEYMGERKVNDKAKSTQEMTATCALYLKIAESNCGSAALSECIWRGLRTGADSVTPHPGS